MTEVTYWPVREAVKGVQFTFIYLLQVLSFSKGDHAPPPFPDRRNPRNGSFSPVLVRIDQPTCKKTQ